MKKTKGDIPKYELFDAVYSKYYNDVNMLINEAVEGTATKRLLRTSGLSSDVKELVSMDDEDEFLSITDGSDKVVTVVKKKLRRPFTTVERRWLKSITLDPRYALFGVDYSEALKDVEPLYTSDDIISIGKYNDGDDYDDNEYRKTFTCLRYAVATNAENRELGVNRAKRVYIEYMSGRGELISGTYVPLRLEYSDREDKFRLYAGSIDTESVAMINLSRISRCETVKGAYENPFRHDEKLSVADAEVTFTIVNERKSLERIVNELSHYYKTVEKYEDNKFRITVKYNSADARELALIMLSYAHYISIEGPDVIRDRIKDKIKKQQALNITFR